MLYGLDLFSGYGGITLALQDYVQPIAYCEIERYAQGILLSRMADSQLPYAPIWSDVSSLDGSQFRGKVDIVYGGFPCQDISVAGAGKGLEGERSGLFYEVCRLVKEIQPSFVFLENVPAIRTRGLREVIRTLTDLGYDCRWTCVSAAEVGAPHLRKRWFLLAHANSIQLRDESGRGSGQSREGPAFPRNDGTEGSLADSHTTGWLRQNPPQSEERRSNIEPARQGHFEGRDSANSWWETEPDVGRVANGVPARVDRIKALGNGVVPDQVKEAFERLIGFK